MTEPAQESWLASKSHARWGAAMAQCMRYDKDCSDAGRCLRGGECFGFDDRTNGLAAHVIRLAGEEGVAAADLGRAIGRQLAARR